MAEAGDEVTESKQEPITNAVVVTENSGGSSDSRARSLANLKPFKPGQSGNPGGRPKGLFSRSARRQLRQEVSVGVKQVDCVVDSLIQKAVNEADVPAATFLRDSCDGKPGPANDAGNGNTHLTIEIVMVGGE